MKFTTTANEAVTDMFYNTGGSFKSNPVENTQYYFEVTALTFTATQANSTVKYVSYGSNTPDVKYSNDGRIWNTWTANTDISLEDVGDKVYVKGNNINGFSTSTSNYTKFSMTGKIAASENIMSLIDDDARTAKAIPCDYCFYNMFYGCTSLESAPELPATTLADYCYSHMFFVCSAI